MLKTRYTVSFFLKVFLLSSISLVSLFIFVRIIDDLSDVIRFGDRFIMWKYLYDIPEIFVEISPMLTFLTGMFILSEMLRYGELKILEISGINHRKIFYVICICGFFTSALSFYLMNFTVPLFTKIKNGISEVKSIHFSSPEYLVYSEKFIYPSYFEKIQISHILGNYNVHVIKANTATYKGENTWEFHIGNEWILDNKGNLLATASFTTKTYFFELQPDVIVFSSKNIETLSYVEIKRLLTSMKKIGVSSTYTKTTFYERVAYPLLNLFLLSLLLPFFSVRKKIARVFVLSSSIALSFIAYGIYAFGFGLAISGKIHPILGVWMLHILILFSLTAYLLKLQKVRKSYII